MSKPVFVYALDPLCGWCFAFTESVAALRRELGDEVDWEVACGGLVVGERVAPIAHAANYLRHGMKAVEARSSARFGPGFLALLEEGTWISQSEPVCRATLLVQRDHGGAAAVDFGSELCRGFYAEGRPPDAPESLRAAAELAGVDAEALLAGWDDPAARAYTREQMALAQRAGLTSYPTLVMRRGDLLIPVLGGFAPPAQALSAARAALKRAA